MDLGTIVSSITPGGPADVNGHLKPGRLGSLPRVYITVRKFMDQCV